MLHSSNRRFFRCKHLVSKKKLLLRLKLLLTQEMPLSVQTRLSVPADETIPAALQEPGRQIFSVIETHGERCKRSQFLFPGFSIPSSTTSSCNPTVSTSSTLTGFAIKWTFLSVASTFHTMTRSLLRFFFLPTSVTLKESAKANSQSESHQ